MRRRRRSRSPTFPSLPVQHGSHRRRRNTTGLARSRPTTLATLNRLVRTVVPRSSRSRWSRPVVRGSNESRSHYSLIELASQRLDTKLVFGMRDDPEAQAQHEVVFEPDRDGNLIAFGASGTGKTTLLRTIAVASGFSDKGGPSMVYA